MRLLLLARCICACRTGVGVGYRPSALERPPWSQPLHRGRGVHRPNPRRSCEYWKPSRSRNPAPAQKPYSCMGKRKI